MTRAILVAGAGGVGKTTVSAALAVVAARRGLTTLVLTVDPARRLADALGAGTLDSRPRPSTQIPGLSASMLDATVSWTNVIRRHAPPNVAERLISHEFFTALAARFPSSQAYAAAEEMTSHIESGKWEVVVVDTPPAAGGVEFFTAPQAMTELIGGNAVRWLTGSGSGRSILSAARRRALRLAGGALGTDLLDRVASFLADLRVLYDGVGERAGEIDSVLAAAQTLLVTSAQPTPLAEVEQFLAGGLDIDPVAAAFNRTLPPGWTDAPSDEQLPEPVAANLANWSAEAARQHGAIADFRARHDLPTPLIPWQATPPTTPGSLEETMRAGELDIAELLG